MSLCVFAVLGGTTIFAFVREEKNKDVDEPRVQMEEYDRQIDELEDEMDRFSSGGCFF